MEIIYLGLRSIEGGSEKKLFSGDLIIRLDEQTDIEVKSREEKKKEVEEKEKVHLLGDNLGASLSRLSFASVSAT